MKLIFLGSGSAFTVGDDNYHSNMILTDGKGKNILIDCGSDARLSTYEQGYTHRDITDAYISHLHADHAGGLEWLAFATKFDPACKKPNLYISETLVDDLWNHVLSGGLRSIQSTIANLNTYFNVYPVKKNGSFIWEGINFQLIQTVHIMNGFCIVPSFGLLFHIGHTCILITADTQFFPNQMMAFYQMADIIFHDCETKENASGVHSKYEELCTLDSDIKAKMWLYHYNPGPLPDAVKDGFRGFIKKGQEFAFK
jgi:ribonuclease BN (tRNA processing enzyme)